MKDNEILICGYSWEDIQRAQQGGRLSTPIDLNKVVAQLVTDNDRALLALHGLAGLAALGLYGVIDRLEQERWQDYERRVSALEAEGITRSDAQAIVDAELLREEICETRFNEVLP